MYPLVLLAGALALYFAVMAIEPPRLAKLLAAILWAVFAPYEYLIANGTLCDANCNIRVDLVLFLPLLGYATYLALQDQPRTGAVAILATLCLAITALLALVFDSTTVAVVAGAGAAAVTVLGLRWKLKDART